MPKKTSTPKRKQTSVMTTPFLHKEQVEFHKKHPNARILLTVFVVLAIVAISLAVYRYGWQPAQAYSMLYLK